MNTAIRRVLTLVLAVVLVGGALAPAVAQAAPKPPAAHLQWTPAAHATYTVQRGQTATEQVSFVSNVDLSNVQVALKPNNAAQQHGVTITLVSPTSAIASVAKNTAFTVIFSVAASASANPGAYASHVHVTGSATGSTKASELPENLDFTVKVAAPAGPQGPTKAPQPAAPHINFVSHSAHVVVPPGQTVTLSVPFSSTTTLTNATVVGKLEKALAKHGVSLSVTPASLGPSVPASTTVTLTIVLTALPTTHPTGGTGEVRVLMANAKGKMVQVAEGLHLDIKVPGPHLNWANKAHVAFPAITHGNAAAVGQTATFTSNVTLTNATLVVKLPADAKAKGVTALAAPIASTIAAGTPTTISLMVNVLPTAQPGKYEGQVLLVATPPGATKQVRLHSVLHFVITVK